ncbi:MAG: chromosomal replication initiator protein DnaA [Lachnospiraceae bacterium]|jgi:chromosomal replication initiator protein|nr:chromosomal replication initiator protein DnaA [Lachnospiraceae bacterium]
MGEELNAFLNEVKESLKKEIPEISYNTWLKDLKIKSINENVVTLIYRDSVNLPFVKSKYTDILTSAFNLILHKDCIISIISEDLVPDEKLEYKNSSDVSYGYSNSLLNPKYTFSNFVVGDNNRLAHSASLAVAEAPAASYNPLFLYGGVGLGKTHLMHAIGNEILKTNKTASVLYVTSEKFTNEFINAIKDNSNEKFRNKYRNIDLLLIDDIQFIAGKERIQEEFFHTFNSLHESGKQIILSSDRPPRDIQFLEDRLKSRFEWGLLADISMADYETRLAILRKKTDETHVIISDDILSNIATKINSNIRELEGVFNKLVATSTLTHAQITLEMSEKAINDIILKKENVVSIDYIIDVVSKYFNVSVYDLKSSKRSNEIAFPRQVCMYLCRNILDMSFPIIGKTLGGRDHSTVMHACNKIEKDIKESAQTKQIIDSIKSVIRNKK